MPTPSIHNAVLLALLLIVGVAAGWLMRGRRSVAEKAAISEGWQGQLRATEVEHKRLAEQNRSLMAQLSASQTALREASGRAGDLAEALGEESRRRDELKRETKAIRTNLEGLISERQRLVSELSAGAAKATDVGELLEEKDRRIARQTSELRKWRQRIPPLIERFRERSAEVDALQAELAAARKRIDSLETMLGSDQTRVEPMPRDSDIASRTASNEGGVFDAAAATAALNALPETSVRETEAESPLLRDAGRRDDLQRIKGIGPAIEKTLNELGIVNFDQLAAMDDRDVERVARRLKGFQDRIHREDWIGQARQMTRNDHGRAVAAPQEDEQRP